MIRHLYQQNKKTSPPGEKVKTSESSWTSRTELMRPAESKSCAAKHPQSFVFLWLFKSARNNVYAWFIHASITGLCLWLTNWINVAQNIRREEYANHAISVFVCERKREKDRIDCLLSPILSSCCCYASQAVLTWDINAVYNDNKLFYLIYFYYYY